MKIILVKPPVKTGQVYNVIPPLGLGYLAQHLRERGHEATILDAIRDNLNAEQTLRRMIGWRFRTTARPILAGH